MCPRLKQGVTLACPLTWGAGTGKISAGVVEGSKPIQGLTLPRKVIHRRRAVAME